MELSNKTVTEIEYALSDAKDTLTNFNGIIRRMASLMRGKMREAGIPGYVLSDLKRELRDWDMHKKRWIR